MKTPSTSSTALDVVTVRKCAFIVHKHVCVYVYTNILYIYTLCMYMHIYTCVSIYVCVCVRTVLCGKHSISQ